jgi:hypothetical protein
MIIPALPSQHFKTYEIIAPLQTHFRPATCEEVECEAWRNGWKTLVAHDSEAALYIRSGASGRRFDEVGFGREPGALVQFLFAPGQKCFAADRHRVPLEREPLYVARGGDARGNPMRERRVHTRASDWQEDFAGHLDRVRQSKGE